MIIEIIIINNNTKKNKSVVDFYVRIGMLFDGGGCVYSLKFEKITIVKPLYLKNNFVRSFVHYSISHLFSAI